MNPLNNYYYLSFLVKHSDGTTDIFRQFLSDEEGKFPRMRLLALEVMAQDQYREEMNEEDAELTFLGISFIGEMTDEEFLGEKSEGNK